MDLSQVPFVNVTESCDVAAFIQELNDVISHHSNNLPAHLLRGCNHVFYNRVPKCGSRSLYETFVKMGEMHGYTVLKKVMGLGRDPSSRLYKIVSLCIYFNNFDIYIRMAQFSIIIYMRKGGLKHHHIILLCIFTL